MIVRAVVLASALVLSLLSATPALADDTPPVAPGSPVEAAGAYTGTWHVDVDNSTTPFVAIATSDAPGGFPGLPSYTYQWYRGATATTASTPATGAGATDQNYTPNASDANQFLRVKVTITLPGFAPTAKVSTPTRFSLVTTDHPALKSTPSNLAHVGETFFVDPNSINTLTFQQQGCLCGGGPYPTLFDHYQWLRDGAAISEATGSQYRATSADLNHKLSVRFLDWHDGYTPGVVTSLSSAKLTVGTIETNSGYPHITIAFGLQLGTSSITEVVADPGALPVSVTYRWLRDGTPISGATHSTYIPVAADNGHVIQIEWKIAKTGYTTKTVTSGSYDFDIRRSGGGPYINGAAVFGQEIEAQLDSYESNYGAITTAAFAYQWYRKVGSAAPVAISGATHRQYTPVLADIGAILSVRVTTSLVPLAPLVETFGPTAVVLGAPLDYTLGTTVDVAPGTGNGQLVASVPAGSVHTTGTTTSWQWFRIPVGHEPIAISGATTPKFTVTSAYSGQQLEVRATIKKTGYASVSFFSDPASFDMSATGESIDGTPQVGRSLDVHATPYMFSGGGEVPNVHRAYQWYRNGVAISGATGESYDLVAADLGKTISLREVATASGAISKTQLLAAVGPVALGENSDFGSAVVTENLMTNVLTATLQGVSPSHPVPVYTYKWYRTTTGDPDAISGATGKTYALVAADAGKKISVIITVTRAGFVSASAHYTRESDRREYSIHIDGGTSVHFADTPVVGSPLGIQYPDYRTDFDGSTPAGDPAFAYQWYRHTVSSSTPVAISGATAATYTPKAADAGYVLQVRVTATYPGYLPLAALSTGSDPVALGSIGTGGAVPLVNVTNGSTMALTASVPSGTFTTPGVTYTYQWMHPDGPDLNPIAGATAATYTLKATDYSSNIAVQVTAHKAGYSPQSMLSAIHNYTLVQEDPSVGGSPAIGQTLTAVPGATTSLGTPVTPSSYAYQWYRKTTGGVITAISGATASTYKITAASLVGQTISVSVRPIKSGYQTRYDAAPYVGPVGAP